MAQAPRTEQRVFLRFANSTIYKFVRMEFHWAQDGSFYLFPEGRKRERGSLISRAGNETQERISRPFKISYHTTGQINFDGPRFPSIYADPLHEIRSPRLLMYQQIPSEEGLVAEDNEVDPVKVIQAPDALPFGVEIWIAPFAHWTPPANTLFAAAFESLFRVQFLLTPPTFAEERFRRLFVKAISVEGNRGKVAQPANDAAASFHHKSAGAPTSWLPLGNGRYRYYFWPAMRCTPQVKCTAPPRMRFHLESAAPYYIQFRLSDETGGLDLDDPFAVIGIKLDAEL